MSDHKRRYVYAAKKSGRVIYIGQTLNFRRRVDGHKCQSPWFADGVHFVQLAAVHGSDKADEIERELIARHQPEYNMLHTDQGRGSYANVDGGLTRDEIAAEIGCSTSSVRVYLKSHNVTPYGRRPVPGRQGPGPYVYHRADVERIIHNHQRRAA